jgi:hypothetical protein
MRKIIFYGILIFIISILAGYFYSSLWKNNNEEISYENQIKLENIAETVSVEEKVSYNSSFALKKYYMGCGHLKTQYSELPIEIINLTENEVKDLYNEWNVEKFSSDEVVLSKDVDGICDEHYILKLGEDNIDVYNIDEEGETKLYKSTNISTDYLTSEDIQNLEEGITVYGISNLNSALEDFE